MSILHLTQEKKWFDMTAEGIKKEEYREIKPYWVKRLLFVDHPEEFPKEGKITVENIVFDLKRHSHQEVLLAYHSTFRQFDWVISKNGYSKNAPVIRWAHKGIRVGTPNPDWCPPEFHGQTFFILEIGQVIK